MRITIVCFVLMCSRSLIDSSYLQCIHELSHGGWGMSRLTAILHSYCDVYTKSMSVTLITLMQDVAVFIVNDCQGEHSNGT